MLSYHVFCQGYFMFFWLAGKLEHTFQDLGFDVIVHTDKTVSDIMGILMDEARLNHSQFDCFVCCIMSHGDQGYVYGSGGNSISIKRFTSYFEASSCPTLAGKPKLFFVQACQGHNTMGTFLMPSDVTVVNEPMVNHVSLPLVLIDDNSCVMIVCTDITYQFYPRIYFALNRNGITATYWCPGLDFIINDLPSVLMQIFADQILNDLLHCSYEYNWCCRFKGILSGLILTFLINVSE